MREDSYIYVEEKKSCGGLTLKQSEGRLKSKRNEKERWIDVEAVGRQVEVQKEREREVD